MGSHHFHGGGCFGLGFLLRLEVLLALVLVLPVLAQLDLLPTFAPARLRGDLLGFGGCQLGGEFLTGTGLFLGELSLTHGTSRVRR